MDDYPPRLGHKTPAWVRSDALFHVRIRALPAQYPLLTESNLAAQLLDAARRYHELDRWWCELILLMPDHLHALIHFPATPGMSSVISDWKRGTARFQRVQWQDNFFEHRIRNTREAQEKWRYIRQNPVVKGLCASEDDWPFRWCCSASDEARWGQRAPP